MVPIVSFGIGLLFAIGLGISGMTLPAKVIGFLDVGGQWDPSLAFVMGGAVTLYFFLFRVVRGHAPMLAAQFNLPTANQIDIRLIAGSALFGIGWGIAGICPGPGIVSLLSGLTDVFVFVAAMCVGMLVFEAVGHRRPHP